MTQNKTLSKFAWLSIAAAIATILLKAEAYYITGSVGLLSDALESFVNLAGAVMALAMLTIASRPPDRDHNFGHGKAEYFSSGVEGALIVMAAISIGYTAGMRLLHPKPVEKIDIGLAVSLGASLINFITAKILLAAGKKHNSITLEANSHHLMTDVWTSAGVLVGVGAVKFTGWLWLDPAVAIIVALNIVVTGFRLVSRSISGLMDIALPAEDQEKIYGIMQKYSQNGLVEYHELCTRQSGAKKFISMHVLVPGAWSVSDGHNLVENIENEIMEAIRDVTVITHLEPIEEHPEEKQEFSSAQ
jgi:cation diffusion facilitator family transporter